MKRDGRHGQLMFVMSCPVCGSYELSRMRKPQVWQGLWKQFAQVPMALDKPWNDAGAADVRRPYERGKARLLASLR